MQPDRSVHGANRSRAFHPAIRDTARLREIRCRARVQLADRAIHGSRFTAVLVSSADLSMQRYRFSLLSQVSFNASLHPPLSIRATINISNVWNRVSRGHVNVIAQNRMRRNRDALLRTILLRALIPPEAWTLNRYSRRSREDYSFISIFADVYATGSCAPEQKSLLAGWPAREVWRR